MLAHAGARAIHMTKIDNLIFTEHADIEAALDGISKSEIAEAVSRGMRIRQNGKFIIIYKYFTVVYKIWPNGKYKIITVFSGHPRKWK